MTPLARVKAERDQQKAERDRYWLALNDVLGGSGRVSPALVATVEQTRYVLRVINRAAPLVIITVQGMTDVYPLEDYRQQLTGAGYTFAAKVPLLTLLGRLDRWMHEYNTTGLIPGKVPS